MIRNPENCRCSVCFESIMIRHLTTVWFISPRQFAVKLEQRGNMQQSIRAMRNTSFHNAFSM